MVLLLYQLILPTQQVSNPKHVKTSKLKINQIVGELLHAVNLTKPKLVFASAETIENLVDVAKEFGRIEKVIVFDETTINNQLILSFTKFVKNPKVKTNVLSFKCLPQNINENVAFILFSSGTTGLPKGVELTQKNVLLANAQY